MPSPTHYQTLGVAPAATQDQIKRAYRKLARRYHPDVSHERGPTPVAGADHHARIEIDLADAYTGAVRQVWVKESEPNAHGRHALRDRQIEITIPKGIREGQKLRLAGQGGAGSTGQRAGDPFSGGELACPP
jgi:curved DNA-binding protein